MLKFSSREWSFKLKALNPPAKIIRFGTVKRRNVCSIRQKGRAGASAESASRHATACKKESFLTSGVDSILVGRVGMLAPRLRTSEKKISKNFVTEFSFIRLTMIRVRQRSCAFRDSKKSKRLYDEFSV